MENCKNLRDVVRYSDFGAVGDGTVDDYDAIVATHEYANEHSLRVEADPGATYYIAKFGKSAIIKTDVDWRDAKFIIDDRSVMIDDRFHWIFTVASDREERTLDLPKGFNLKNTDTNVGLKFERGVLLFIENENEKVYLRYMKNRQGEPRIGAGYNKQEVVIVDGDGNLDASTPLIFDYPEVTALRAYATDDKPVTVKGGVFTTWANVQEGGSIYYRRGIYVSRSNTTLCGVTHLIDKEPEGERASCPYIGFFFAEYTSNITFDSCVMTSHKTYASGTYDTQVMRATGITWRGCTQSNAIDLFAKGYWGVMASKFSKNLTYDGCVLSRFDAHEGAYNVTVKNSVIGEVINIVGGGRALIENTTVTSGNKNYFIRIREDYGSTWNGDIYVKNCKMCVTDEEQRAYIIRADWNEHYFGYGCYVPNLYVDGFSVERSCGAPFDGSLSIFKSLANTDEDLRNNGTNPLGAPEEFFFSGITHPFEVMENRRNDIIISDTKITKQ